MSKQAVENLFEDLRRERQQMRALGLINDERYVTGAIERVAVNVVGRSLVEVIDGKLVPVGSTTTQ